MTPLHQRLTDRHPDLEPEALGAALKAVTEEAWELIQDRASTLHRSPDLGDLARLDEVRMLASRVFELGQLARESGSFNPLHDVAHPEIR